MSLLYAWQFNPAVTYDLDLLDETVDPVAWETTDAFEDVYLLTAFTLYNRRCLWPRYYRTLDRATVISNADFILAGRGTPRELGREYPGYSLVKSLRAGDKEIHVLRAETLPRPSYRALYANAFLADRRPTADDRAVIEYDLSMNRILRGDAGATDENQETFAPGATRPSRTIYWTGHYQTLQKMAVRLKKK